MGDKMTCMPFSQIMDWVLEEKKATVEVLKSSDKWYGVTYKEDKEVVVEAIKNMKAKGLYPEKLWEESHPSCSSCGCGCSGCGE